MENSAPSHPTIRRKFHGGMEDQNFTDFAYSTIQDRDVARRVANTMLASGVVYEWNPDEPEFYEEFEVIDSDGLRAQLKAAE